MSRLLATVLAVVLAQHLLAGVALDLGADAVPAAAGVLLVGAGLGLRARRRAPYLGDGVVVALLVPLRGPLCDLVRLVAPGGTAGTAIALALVLGPLGLALGRQLGRALHGALAPVLAGAALGAAASTWGAATLLPSWAVGALTAAALAALAESARPHGDEPAPDRGSPAALLAGALLALWVLVLVRVTSAYTSPSSWPVPDALVAMLGLGAVVAWPGAALARQLGPRAGRALAAAGAALLAAALWSSLSELALYRDAVRAVDLGRRLHDRATQLGPLDEWWLWLATFAGLRAAALGLVLGAFDARAAGALAVGAGAAVLGATWLAPVLSVDPMLMPAHELLAAGGLALALVPAALWGRRGLLLAPVAVLPFLLVPATERPRFDEIRRRGEFSVHGTQRDLLADAVLYSTPDASSLSVEGRQAARTTCTCEAAALALDGEGALVRTLDHRADGARPCYGVRVGGLSLYDGHAPIGPAGSAGRLLRVFVPRGRLLVAGVGAEVLAADLHDAGLLEQATVASDVPLGTEITLGLVDALGGRGWSAGRVVAPHEALGAEGGLDGIVVAPEHASWGSAASWVGVEALGSLARRLAPGGRCVVLLDTRALDAGALAARLAAFGGVFGARSAAFVEPRELDPPYVLLLGWVDDAGRPEVGALRARLAELPASPLRVRLADPDDLGALLLRDGEGLRAAAEDGAPLRRTRPRGPRRGADTGWAAVAEVADGEARLARVASGAGPRGGAAAEVLAGLAVHATYDYRLADLNDTTFSVPEDVDWAAFDEEAAHYAAASARAKDDPLLHLVLGALLEPLAMAGDYGRFARVYEACGARDMPSRRLALLEAWVQRQALEEEAAQAALVRARALGGG